MKKLTIIFLSILVFGACQKKSSKIIDRHTYKQVLKEIILANLIKQKITKNDSLKKNIKLLIYKKYNIDSISLKKTTDFYSQHPDQLQKIYSEIYTEFKQKSDSLEKLAPHKKPKNDQIKIDKKILDLKNIKKKLP